MRVDEWVSQWVEETAVGSISSTTIEASVDGTPLGDGVTSWHETKTHQEIIINEEKFNNII